MRHRFVREAKTAGKLNHPNIVTIYDSFESEEMRHATIEDFQLARSLGVTGFPTVVVKDDEGYAYLTVGYQPYGHLGAVLDAWLDGRAERRAAE